MVYISVDVEASGPLPAFFDLLSIGAVAVAEEDGVRRTLEDEFYVEMKPFHGTADPEAMKVNGLDLDRLAAEGTEPAEAARRLDAWVSRVAPRRRAVFVGYCANFDWAYVNDLFHRAGIANPFGYKALDIRSLAHGVFDLPWDRLTQDEILPRLGLAPLAADEAHHALADARHQARMLDALLTARSSR